MVLALAFASTSLTLLRLGELPIGVPELVMLGIILLHLPLGGGIHADVRSSRFAPGLFLLFAATLPGFFVTLTGQGLLPDVMHNLLAMTWMVVLFTYMQFGFDYRRGELEWLCGLVLVFSCVYFAFCLGLTIVSPDVVFAAEDFTEFDIAEVRNDDFVARQRLAGFAANPNQLGLHAIVVLFFCLRYWRSAGTFKSVLALALILVTGALTGSDSFILGALLMLGTAILFGLMYSGSVYLMLMLLVPGVVGLVILHRPLLARLNDFTSAGGQDATRFALWENGWLAMLERPLFGWGPGSWSGQTAPFEFSEAHNSVIDYITYSGLVGAFVMAAGIAAILFGALRSRQATLVAGVVGILFFALFHHTLRQPLMWLSMFYISHHLWAAVPATAGRRRRSRRGVGRAGGGIPV